MSVSKKIRERGKILDEIMRYHREQLPRLMREVPLASVRAFAAVAPPALDFVGALKEPGVSLIAECKKASPSKGLIAPRYDAVGLARAYAKAGAAAISVLTDARHFQGRLEDLRDVREVVNRPLLRKDFIFHPYQVYEARAAGADAVLLIAAVLGDRDLADLQRLAGELGMAALIEVHSAAEIERVLALDSPPHIVGINNRNLQTFAVDFERTRRLRGQIPPGIVVVGESGIKTSADIQAMAALGVDAVLVGETLVRAADPGAAARQLISAGRPPKNE